MTEEQYNSFGWVRANNVINAGYYRNFTENFAQAVEKIQKYPISKSGEFMIAVYDIYSDSEIADVVVFANGTIESPNITKIVKFNLTDESELNTKRRNLYETARRGIQPKAGEILDIYYKTDFIGGRREYGNSIKGYGNNNGLGVKRSRSEIKAYPIVEFYVNEDENTVTYIYANGDKITERLVDENSSKKSSESGKRASMDSDYMAAVNRGDMVTAQRMVDEAAKKAGYTVKGYHGSHNSFTVFDEGKSGLYGGIESKIGFWFGATRKGAENWVSETWRTEENNPQVYESWLKIEKPKVFATTEMDSEAIKKSR